MLVKVSFLDKQSEKEFKGFSEEMAADFSRTINLMIEFGAHNIGMPHVRKLIGAELWEIRVKGKSTIGRVLYGVKDKEMIILHCFIKKTQKTPLQSVNLAIERWKEIK